MSIDASIEKARARAAELEETLSQPDAYADQRRASDLARELQRLRDLVALYERRQSVQRQIAENEDLVKGTDTELAELAAAELATLRTESQELDRAIQLGLVPPDPHDSRNTIVEIRAGAGGEEAALFAADLFPHVQPLRRLTKLENRDHGQQRQRTRWVQGDCVLGPGPGCLQAVAV